MELIRSQSSSVGRVIAESLKKEGRTLDQLIARKTMELFGPAAEFAKLTLAQQNGVFAAIVQSAGKSGPKVTNTMRRLSYAGCGLIVLSVALSIYSIAQAQDKQAAADRELTITGASMGGGVAGGALAAPGISFTW